MEAAMQQISSGRSNPVTLIVPPATIWTSEGVTVLIMAAVIVLWHFAAQESDTVRALFSEPALIWSRMVDITLGGHFYREGDPLLFDHVFASAKRVGVGLCLGIAFGFPVGVGLVLLPTLERAGAKALIILFAAPNLAMFYIFVIWFGFGETGKLIFLAWGAFLYQAIMVFHGLKGILSNSRHPHRELIERAVGDGVTRMQLYRYVLVPFSLPQLFVGLRFAAARSWAILVVIEMSGTTRGIGHLIANAFLAFDIPALFAYTIILTLCSYATWTLVRFAEKKVLRWNVQSPI